MILKFAGVTTQKVADLEVLFESSENRNSETTEKCFKILELKSERAETGDSLLHCITLVSPKPVYGETPRSIARRDRFVPRSLLIKIFDILEVSAET